MSFDINPLGNAFYLQQLEREVSHLNAVREASSRDETKAPAKSRGRLARLLQAIRVLQARPAA